MINLYGVALCDYRAIGLSSVRPKYLFMENFGEFTKAKCGLDMEHLKVVLGKMAKFHAATAVLHSNVNIF